MIHMHLCHAKHGAASGQIDTTDGSGASRTQTQKMAVLSTWMDGHGFRYARQRINSLTTICNRTAKRRIRLIGALAAGGIRECLPDGGPDVKKMQDSNCTHMNKNLALRLKNARCGACKRSHRHQQQNVSLEMRRGGVPQTNGETSSPWNSPRPV
ncbi:unnamed protein product [Ectocarpus sp. 12 AP-2014]